MALDTKAKRQSVIGIARPWMRNTFPVATPTESWRMDASGLYNGNALSPAAGGFQPVWAIDSSMLIGSGFSV